MATKKATPAALLAPKPKEAAPVPFDWSTIQVPANGQRLADISQLADMLRRANGELLQAQMALKEAEAKVNELVLEVIPDALKQAGTTEVKLEDGTKVFVKPDLNVSISEANRPAAHAWFRANGLASIIKSQFVIDVRALEDEELRAALRKLTPIVERMGAEMESKEAVHATTLKSNVKELVENGIALPPCFSVYQFNKAGLKERSKGK